MGLKEYFLMEKIKELLQKDTDILFAYLYGSYATQTTLPDSDIDIAVYLKEENMDYYLKKDEELLGSIPNDNIDIRILNTMPLLLKFRVIKEGKIIFSQDEQKRVDFEYDVMERYFELKPYIDEYEEVLKERITND